MKPIDVKKNFQALLDTVNEDTRGIIIGVINEKGLVTTLLSAHPSEAIFACELLKSKAMDQVIIGKGIEPPSPIAKETASP